MRAPFGVPDFFGAICQLMALDDLIQAFDGLLKTALGEPHARRALPGQGLADTMPPEERTHAAGLMRVNHAGEVCAQGLYQGQALVARDPALRQVLLAAARDEEDHLAWTAGRLAELGARTSLLVPFWYAGAFVLGAAAGLAGQRWSLGFLAETESQVERHLTDHLAALPPGDTRSRAILREMRADEARHGADARARGGSELPPPLRLAMRATAKLLTRGAYYL